MYKFDSQLHHASILDYTMINLFTNYVTLNNGNVQIINELDYTIF